MKQLTLEQRLDRLDKSLTKLERYGLGTLTFSADVKQLMSLASDSDDESMQWKALSTKYPNKNVAGYIKKLNGLIAKSVKKLKIDGNPAVTPCKIEDETTKRQNDRAIAACMVSWKDIGDYVYVSVSISPKAELDARIEAADKKIADINLNVKQKLDWVLSEAIFESFGDKIAKTLNDYYNKNK